MRSYNEIHYSIRYQNFPIKASDIILSDSDINVIIGNNPFQITAQIVPEETYIKLLSWDYTPKDGSIKISNLNENNSIVQISFSKVGTYSIFCKSLDGSDIKKECHLTVNKQ